MTGKHAVLDHPVIGYFVLFIFTIVFSSVGAYVIDTPLTKAVPGYTSSPGVGAAIGVIIATILFTIRFRPDFKGILGVKGFMWGIAVMLPFLLADYIGAAVDLYTFGSGNVLVAFFSALAPGFTEEAAFRGPGVANYMRTIKSEKQIPFIFWLSTLLFGLIHITNIIAGGNPVAVIFQVIYCIGVGAVFGAVYLRTANLWVIMIAHFTLDFAGLVNSHYASTGGLSTELLASDWINLVVAAIGIVTALVLISPKNYPEIMKVWKEKWSMSKSRGKLDLTGSA